MTLKNLIFIPLYICVLFLNSSFSQDDEEVVHKSYKTGKVEMEYKSTETFSASELKNIIKTGNSDYFNFEDYLVDKKRIEKFYFDNGFFDAFVDTSIVLSNEKISVKFIIEENQPYTIGKINYSGLSNLPQDLMANAFLSDVLETTVGDVYSKNKVTSESGRILKFLQNNGYASANMTSPEIVKIETANPDLKHKITINLNYEPGIRYRFGKTIVAINNQKYNLYLEDILHELEYQENDIYSKEILMQSENRLNRISVLENTRIVVSDIDTINNIINLKILGLVRNKYELQPEILGYEISNSFFAGLGMSYTDRFFLHNPRTFSAKVRALANSTQNYRLEFILEMFQPHIFNNNKITGNLNLSNVLYSIDQYRIIELKSKASVNYELPKHTYLNNIYVDWKLTDQRVTFKVPLIALETDSTYSIIPEGSFVNILNSIIGFTFVHSKTDNFQFPTKGFYQSYLLEESGLISSLIQKFFDVSTVKYLKFSFINKFYMPVTSRGEKSTIATKFLIGDIYEYGDNSLVLSSSSKNYGLDVVPIDSKFIAGGSTSVRGWGARKLGTFDNRNNGGDFIVEGTIEHRTRPFYDQKGLIRDFGFVSFVDFGNLWSDIKYYKTTDIAVAIGVGLRYYTIVGPVRLDFGFKFYDYEPAPGTNKWLFRNNASAIFNDKFAIQFGIGNTF
jgi:outer membrane protein insertion porin family